MIKKENSHRYDDIINLPHPTSSTHARMPHIDRAAQFSPFAALSGYDDAVKETSRITDIKSELSDDEKASLDAKLRIVETLLGSDTVFHFIYFVPDDRKEGGSYVPYSGSVRKIDLDNGIVLLNDHTVIEIAQIVGIESDVFESFGL